MVAFLLIGFLLLSCASCGSKQTPGVNKSDVKFSGDANDDATVKWTMYDDGEMVFSGTGEYHYSDHAAFSDTITRVTFLSGITALCNDDAVSDSCFADCTYLEAVYIPVTVQQIDSGVFQDCLRMSDVYYEGTKEQWNAIKIDENNNSLLYGAEIHYNSWKSQ